MNIESTKHEESTNPPLLIASVSGSISVTKGNNPLNIQITSKSDFFKTPIVYKVTEDVIEFRKPTIDDNKRIVKPTIDKKNGFYHFFISTNFQIDFKKYDFDDSIDEDVVSVYYQ